MLRTALLRMVDIFPANVLMQGQICQRHGHVLNIRLSDGLLKARVKGTLNQIYDVHMDLKKWPGMPSHCSCLLRQNCKHAAACLYALQENAHVESGQVLARRHQLGRERVIDADAVEWYSELNEETNEFFSYELGILVGDKRVSVVPIVIDLLNRYDYETLEQLPDTQQLKLSLEPGLMLQVSLGRMKPLLRLLLQYGQSISKNATLHLNRYQLLLLQEAEQAVASSQARWCDLGQIKRQLQELISLSSLPPIQKPTLLLATLRDYQQQGLNWLQGLRASRLGGVLADDMGLGKTVQTLAHLLYEKAQKRMTHASLIVAPTSLVGNWYEEIRRFAPSLKVLIFHGSERHHDDFNDYDVVISTYGLIQRDKKRFLEYHFYFVILDEAQLIKNARNKTTQVVQQLRGIHRLCLTGTPLENHLGELWSLFHFLMPGFLGTARQFRQFFRAPIEKHGDVEKQTLLVQRIKPFLLRRSKNQVATELPLKTEILQMLELTAEQRDLYEAIRMSMEKKVRDALDKQGLGKSQIILLDALLKLRQACCDPRLVNLPAAAMAHGVSVKLASLLQLLETVLEEGRSVLVFSQFTSMLSLIELELKKRHYRYLCLTGQTQNRQAIVNAFQAGEAPIFLISLKAGGMGLNLTRADTVIHYDPWWNPAVEDQATDRSYRIGQVNPVFVYKLLCKGTVEETMLAMQAKKRQLFEGVLANPRATSVILTEEDIDAFFAPLTS